MDRNAIMERLEALLVDKYAIPADVVKQNHAQPLTGEVFRMNGIDLTYFFFDVLHTFGCTISEDALKSGGFSTIERIADTIAR